MAEVDLKGCPFCGGEAYIKSAISLDDLRSGHVIISCSKCSSSIQEQTVLQAIKAWNRRADDDLYKKGYKDGWNSCVKDKADGWMIDYI